MKGMVFTEFLEMVESRWSYGLVDRILEEARLPSGGAYTSVGTYDHAELWSLLSQLSRATHEPVPELLKAFGAWLMQRFEQTHPAFFAAAGLFDFLASVDGVIHAEVRKLYPDAELPHVEVVERTPDRLLLVYRSPRHFGDLAEGLIAGAAQRYGEAVRIVRTTVPQAAGTQVRFAVERT